MSQISNDIFYKKLQAIIDLCETISEAAQYLKSSQESIETVKTSLLDGIEAVYNNLSTFVGNEKLPITVSHEKHVKIITNSGNDEIEQNVSMWHYDVVISMVSLFANRIQKECELPSDIVESCVSMIDKGFAPISLELKSKLRMILAMSCVSTAPLISFNLMEQAFTDTPLLAKLLFSNVQHLKTYTYAPEAHPQIKFDSCPICGDIGVPYYAAASCLMGDFSDMALPFKLWMKCENCGNLFTKYFQQEYFSRAKKPYKILPKGNPQIVDNVDYRLLCSWSRILNKLNLYTTGNDLLEVGIGKGYLIAAAQEMGYNVSAVEISVECAQDIANKLNIPIICGDFLDIDENEKYSIITMGDVLEHLKNPTAGLKKAYRLLNDDGVLWLSTPNYLSAYACMTRTKNPMWREPNHVTYFSREGLYKILHEVGFSVVEYTVSERYLGSMELILRKS